MLESSITSLFDFANAGLVLADGCLQLIAQAADGAADAVGGGDGDGGAQPGQPVKEVGFLQRMLSNPLILPIGLFLIFYLTFLAPERKKRAEEAKLMSSLQKNDRVITIGGIHGTVVSVGDGVITLKVDESGSTRIKVNRTAIATRVVDKKEKDGEGSKD